jgi:hypothetical protein
MLWRCKLGGPLWNNGTRALIVEQLGAALGFFGRQGGYAG